MHLSELAISSESRFDFFRKLFSRAPRSFTFTLSFDGPRLTPAQKSN